MSSPFVLQCTVITKPVYCTSSFPATVQSALQKLLLHITECVRPAVEDVVARKVVDEGNLDAWCKCVLMAKWTGVSGMPRLTSSFASFHWLVLTCWHWRRGTFPWPWKETSPYLILEVVFRSSIPTYVTRDMQIGLFCDAGGT